MASPGSASQEQVSSVVSFLFETYHSVAETLPDYRDETWDVETSLVDGHSEDRDAYSDLLAHTSELPAEMTGKKPGKASKTRKKKRALSLNLERKPENCQYEEKWLPPGFMKDHWELYRKRQRGFKCASFSTFWCVSSNLHCARMFQFF